MLFINDIDPRFAADTVAKKISENQTLSSILRMDGAHLCGGAVLDMIIGDTPRDYDIFFTKEPDFDGYRFSRSTHYTKEFLNKDGLFQFVHKKIYESPELIISDFDLLPICLFANLEKLGVGEGALESIATTTVGVNVITRPLQSLNRLVKYSAIKKWDVGPAYNYILSVMMDRSPNICLNGVFYEDD